MARTYKNLYPEIVSFQNLFLASQKAQKGKRYRESTLEFNMELEKNLFTLQEELQNRIYKHGPYRDFIVKDSKKRLISGAPDDDLDGEPRPSCSGYDMGAYEYQCP